MRIYQMTASLTIGDAIGNYALTLRRILGELGYEGGIFADIIHPALGYVCRPSSEYRPTGRDVLWFHYSIGADNFRYLTGNPDRMIMDFHGITPPHLMGGDNGDLARLAQQGIAALPDYVNCFRLCLVHSDYSGDVLRLHGYRRVEKTPLVVDTSRFEGGEDETLSRWLARLEYALFVGRIVPQKGLLDLVYTFAHLKRLRPAMKLFLVGDPGVLPGYTRQVEALIRDLKLSSDVVLTGPVAAPDMLTSLYRRAAVTILLSEWESFCVPVIESLYFGTPVVCNDLPPLREAANNGGVLVQRERHAETAQAIHALLEDRARYTQLQAAGRAWAAEFTPDALRARLRALLPLIVE